MERMFQLLQLFDQLPKTQRLKKRHVMFTDSIGQESRLNMVEVTLLGSTQ